MSTVLAEQKTKFIRNEDVQRKWILIDASGHTIGRLASRIAYRLSGKHRPDYAPHQETGDYIVVINAAELVVTGAKLDKKLYHEHSGRPGGLNSSTLRQKMDKDPAWVLNKAVKRMLPKNKLGRKLLGNVKIYAGTEHPHTSQAPEIWEPKFK